MSTSNWIMFFTFLLLNSLIFWVICHCLVSYNKQLQLLVSVPFAYTEQRMKYEDVRVTLTGSWLDELAYLSVFYLRWFRYP